MDNFYTISSIFLSAFGFALGVGGLIGMIRTDRDGENLGLRLTDSFLTGGLFTLVSDISANWSHRPVPRRLICIGLAMNVLALITASLS